MTHKCLLTHLMLERWCLDELIKGLYAVYGKLLSSSSSAMRSCCSEYVGLWSCWTRLHSSSNRYSIGDKSFDYVGHGRTRMWLSSKMSQVRVVFCWNVLLNPFLRLNGRTISAFRFPTTKIGNVPLSNIGNSTLNHDSTTSK